MHFYDPVTLVTDKVVVLLMELHEILRECDDWGYGNQTLVRLVIAKGGVLVVVDVGHEHILVNREELRVLINEDLSYVVLVGNGFQDLVSLVVKYHRVGIDDSLAELVHSSL